MVSYFKSSITRATWKGTENLNSEEMDNHHAWCLTLTRRGKNSTECCPPSSARLSHSLPLSTLSHRLSEEVFNILINE